MQNIYFIISWENLTARFSLFICQLVGISCSEALTCSLHCNYLLLNHSSSQCPKVKTSWYKCSNLWVWTVTILQQCSCLCHIFLDYIQFCKKRWAICRTVYDISEFIDAKFISIFVTLLVISGLIFDFQKSNHTVYVYVCFQPVTRTAKMAKESSPSSISKGSVVSLLRAQGLYPK